MELVGLFLVIVALWCGYCGVESFNPLSLALAILSAPTSAQSVLDQAKAQRAQTVAVAGSSQSLYAGSYSPSNPLQPLGGNYGTFSGYKIADSFAGHIARNSTAPGIDFAMPSGTPLYSPFSGTVINKPNVNPLAGNQVVVKLSNGYTFAIDHVKVFLLGNGTHIQAGQAIALSGGGTGDPGRGDATGPHAHVQLQNANGAYIPFNSIPFG